MDLNQIKQILDLVREHEISEFEIEHDGLRLKVRKDTNGAHVVTLPASTTPAVAVPAPASVTLQPPGEAAQAAADALADAEIELAVVKSPIVGTFYRSASPEADPFAQVGERIAKGKILCIIESMKLMNEIESDVEGEVVAVYPRNGQPVEYGEKLFAIRLAA